MYLFVQDDDNDKDIQSRLGVESIDDAGNGAAVHDLVYDFRPVTVGCQSPSGKQSRFNELDMLIHRPV